MMGSRYEIRVRGLLRSDWSAWFGGLEISSLPGGETRLVGEVSDQPALFGILARIRDMGLTLVLVRRLGSARDDEQAALSGLP